MPTLTHRIDAQTYFSAREAHVVRVVLALLNETRAQLTPPLPPVSETQLTTLLRQVVHADAMRTGGP